MQKTPTQSTYKGKSYGFCIRDLAYGIYRTEGLAAASGAILGSIYDIRHPKCAL